MAHSYNHIGQMFLTPNAMQNYLSFLCYADWIFCMSIQKHMFIVWTSYVYCFLVPKVCLQMENSVSLMMGGKELLKKVQLHRHITHNVGKGHITQLSEHVQEQSSFRRRVSGIPNDHTQQLVLFARLGQWKTLSLFSLLWFPTLYCSICKSRVADCFIATVPYSQMMAMKAGKAIKQCGSSFS